MLETSRRPVRGNLKQEVAQHVRDLILSGELRPGIRIDQDAIADELGVSRLPVREALITLETEGLVEGIARRGMYVAQLERDDIRDHYEMYGMLSGIAASRLAGAPDAAVLEQLESVQREMRATEDPHEHDRLNYAFHQLINRAGASRRLRSVLRVLSQNMPSAFFAQPVEWDWKERAIAEHDDIISALRDGDADAAFAKLSGHFRHTGEQAVRVLERQGFWDAPADSVATA
ncbi:GntR family transcriptional regulator [Microbacterium pseudoresistens]|uniref:DNA-binding GntR family transcriptional regulator n=1 Tax=Microbacterium pseudoresistens TaxID=640634 RepID=A0A7Y9EUL4_9MICO|nr:GntR family transcriptional regulator [Microbacterium pseudoresistens]NYD54269.1 DNA-binding GntR family transcriptional regulator [Microbacterium pseudoresistens]